MKRMFFGLLLCLLCKAAAFSAPVFPSPVTAKQPDGSTLTIVGHGDEFCHFITTDDGYTVVKGTDGFYHYADLSNGLLEPTPVRASNIIDRRIDEQDFLKSRHKYLAPDMVSTAKRMRQLREGHSPQAFMKQMNSKADKPFRGLLLLVNFSDRKFSWGDESAHDFYNDMMNKEAWTGYNDKFYGPQTCTGSVRDYFSDNSNAKYVPQFDVVGPIEIGWSQYDVNGVERAFELVETVLAAADSKVDFSQYDSDGDGDVDMFYIIYAGYTSSYVGNDERLIWPHAATLVDESGEDPDIIYDGVRMARFACSTEIYGWEEEGDRMLDGIGVICHEFSHVLGFQDHYDTSGGIQEHPNTWDLMSSGCYNGEYNRTPCAYNSYEKHSAGFISVNDIGELDSVQIQMASTETSEDACIIHSMQPKVHFYMENRQPDKWDSALPGHGMLVWRVDSVYPIYWEANALNATMRTCFRLVRACGTQGNILIGVEDTDFDPFPGTRHVRQLNNDPTAANLLSYDQYASPVVLNGIAENDGVISFTVEQDPLSDNLPVSYTICDKLYVTGERLEGDEWVTVSWTATVGTVSQSDGSQMNVIFNLLPNTLNIEAEGRDYSNGVYVEYRINADKMSFVVNAQRVALYPDYGIWLCNYTDVDQHGAGNIQFKISRHGIPSLVNPDAMIGYCSVKPSAFLVTQNNIIERLVVYRNLTFSNTARGDVDGNGRVSIDDVTTLIDMLLAGNVDGNANADVDGDGSISIGDVTELIDILLKGTV